MNYTTICGSRCEIRTDFMRLDSICSHLFSLSISVFRTILVTTDAFPLSLWRAQLWQISIADRPNGDLGSAARRPGGTCAGVCSADFLRAWCPLQFDEAAVNGTQCLHLAMSEVGDNDGCLLGCCAV
jgi:hypothetical protein